MKRLGYLSFNSNERTGHQARELKSVKVNSNAYLLRLVVQQCHTNKLNIYNQVRSFPGHMPKHTAHGRHTSSLHEFCSIPD